MDLFTSRQEGLCISGIFFLFLVRGMYTDADFKQCYRARVDIFPGPMNGRLLSEEKKNFYTVWQGA